MQRLSSLPLELGSAFAVTHARLLGVPKSRLRGPDLIRPFHGVRLRSPRPDPDEPSFTAMRRRELELLHALATRLLEGQFFSHRSAAVLRDVPLPALLPQELHLSVHSPRRAPRIAGVVGHRIDPTRCPIDYVRGIPLSSSATTWAMLGSLGLSPTELVAAGDQLVRLHRAGYGRRDVGKAPFTTREELESVLALGHWPGLKSLRSALALIREDSWSPQESLIRVELLRAGIPEPELNVDHYAEDGTFLGCLDMSWAKYRVGFEYHGLQHGKTYDADVERIAAFRAERWEIIEATRATRRMPGVIQHRVATALINRGWSET